MHPLQDVSRELIGILFLNTDKSDPLSSAQYGLLGLSRNGSRQIGGALKAWLRQACFKSRKMLQTRL
jgi:hypothetical protein